MKKLHFYLLLPVLFFISNAYSQTDTIIEIGDFIELKGTVIDAMSRKALPYVNVIITKKKQGTVTNENGDFLFTTQGLVPTDTIQFHYIGYKNKNIAVQELLNATEILLEKDVFSIDEVVVLSKNIDPKDIVKSVLIYKEENYPILPRKEQIFVRKKEIGDLEKFDVIYKKNNIEDLNEEVFREFQKKIPKLSISYDDFLGIAYSNKSEEGKKILKIDPIKKVKLKSPEIAEVKQLETVFENLLNDTDSKEYWKIKSGIFGTKINEDSDDDEDMDSINSHQSEFKDSVKTKNVSRSIAHKIRYSTFNDKEKWEFLHKTNSYKYTLNGGTNINGEDVYIIDFSPKKRGLYEGRLYISMESFALIRADYKFAPEKHGKDFHLLGISYVYSHFSGSVYFEKSAKGYQLKYFSYKKIEEFGVKRSVALQKKKKRFLLHKKLKELKIKLDLEVKTQEQIEFLVLDGDASTSKEFEEFNQRKKFKIIYVDEFSDDLWKGYSVIEPTQQMREYKKPQIE